MSFQIPITKTITLTLTNLKLTIDITGCGLWQSEEKNMRTMLSSHPVFQSKSVNSSTQNDQSTDHNPPILNHDQLLLEPGE